ncbi:MAG: hypothetical protein J6D26_08480 [Clostridia bacterium]|nr:hypothetical protein [Clostridia bacterium]
MKIKLSKIMAAVTALGVTFAGFSAMAAATITTTTDYDYTKAADATATVSVQTVVSGVEQGDEITYYVHNNTVSANDGILYIDQQTAGSDGKATFNFSGVAQSVLYDGVTVAKNGADIKDWSVETFTFKPGANYISSAADAATHAETGWYTYTGMTEGAVTNYETDTDEAGVSYKAVVFTGKVEGNPSEYGVKLVDGDTVKELKALGCDEDGNFVIVLRVNAEDDATWSTVTSSLNAALTYVKE